MIYIDQLNKNYLIVRDEFDEENWKLIKIIIYVFEKIKIKIIF